MKKLTILIISCILLLSGCSAKDKNAEISSGKDILVTVGNQQITKSTLYNIMLNNSGINEILLEAENFILDREIEITSEMEEEAKESLENLSSMYGDYFADMVQYYGYANEDDFYQNALLFNIRVDHLIKKHISENLAEFKETYTPKKINVLIFSGIEDASNAHAAIEKGTSFEEAAETFHATTSYFDKVITSSNTFFDSNVVNYVSGVTEPAYSGTILSSKDSTCFLIQVTSVDSTEYEEEAIEAIATDVSSLSTDVLIHYLDQYNFTIYDKGIYDSFKTELPNYLVQSK